MIASDSVPSVESFSDDAVDAASAGEAARAGTYRLLALLLGNAPSAEVLDVVTKLSSPGDTTIEESIRKLARVSLPDI